MSYYNPSNITTVERLAAFLLKNVKRSREGQVGRGKGNKITNSLTKEDMVEILKNQNVSCAKTNYPFLPFSDRKLFRASADRINSSKPYEKGNIQIVLTGINYMKNDASDSDLNELLEIIKQA
jgi:hypothetical protein